MKTTKIMLATLAVMLFCSCEKVIEFDPGEIEPYVVMVSRPEADSTVSVYLSYSRFFLDGKTEGKEITDGTVTLEVNGVPTTGTYVDTYSGSGRYVVNVNPHAGDSLRLTATVPGYEKTVVATTCIPQRPQYEMTDFVIDTSESIYREWDSSWHKEYVYFKFRLKVKRNSPDEYYAVSIKIPDSYMSQDGVWDTTYMMTVYFEVNDPLVNSQDMEDLIDGYDGRFWGNQMTFSTEGFDGDEHEFTITFDNYFGNMTNNLDFSKMPVRVSMKAISSELYRYNQTTASQSDLDELFGEPVQVYCNVEGGIGIFGATSVKNSYLSNPRFEKFNHDGGYYYKK